MRNGWVETNLLDVVEVLDRFRKPINATERESRQGSVPYYGANGQTGWIDDFLFDEELVLLGEDAIDFADPSARKAYLIDGPSWVNNHAHVLRAKIDKVESYFLAESLNKVDFSQYVSFGTRSKLTQASMNGITIPLPPLTEQKRIVDLISSVDSYIEALQQQLDSVKRSRNAVLHELLTAGGEDWLRVGLSEICTMIKRGQAPSYTEHKSVTVLNQKCIRNGRINYEFARQTDFKVKPINEWAYLGAEDTLVNSTGVGTLGRVAFVGKQDEPLTVDSHITIVRPDKNKIFPAFLGLSLHFREKEIEGLSAGSSGQTELSREALGNLIITIPPLPEQKRIVEIIASMDIVANQTQLAIIEARNLRSGLLSNLLSGEHEIPSTYDKVFGAA